MAGRTRTITRRCGNSLRPTPADYGLSIRQTAAGSANRLRPHDPRRRGGGDSRSLENGRCGQFRSPPLPSRERGRGEGNAAADSETPSPLTLSQRERGVIFGRQRKPFSRSWSIWPTRSPSAGREIPYSTVAAIDFAAGPPLETFFFPRRETAAAVGRRPDRAQFLGGRKTGAKPGDTVRIAYFEPESGQGGIHEKSVTLRLAAIAE